MGEGIAWIGARLLAPVSAEVPGMAGGISLTAARGIAPGAFLVALGADAEELTARTPYRDLAGAVDLHRRPSSRVNAVAYGTCGEWVFVLEDWGAATWATGLRSVASMAPRPGQEIVCVSLNRFSPPSQLLHVPGDERARRAEFGEDTGGASALDSALHAAGAVFPAIGEVGEAAVVAYYEEHGPRLPEAVFGAVGDYCGLRVDEAAVRAGDLPGVLLPLP
ncbi:hypothetical protein [Streptomyces sp. NPDC088785]|uniref:hypothetical protein n=1 Tax=Streptomyces sp. NPDC088785 TaxID=3365897 RepID=UPI00380160A2